MFQQYLSELSKVHLLTPVEEEELWVNLKRNSSKEARRRIIESYQPLVYKIASRITGREELVFDLIQEGMVGLIEAVESFEPDFGAKFSTYAQYRIRGRMIDLLKKSRLARECLEIAVNQEEFQDYLLAIADQKVDVEEEATINMISHQVNQAISRLGSKEQKVIRDLYVLDKEPMLSAQEMNISLSYYYKLQKKALQRLRGMLTKLRSEIKSGGS